MPIPPDDPLYGRRPPENEGMPFLGEMAILGERGMFLLSSDGLLRIRHNPFYEYLEAAVIDWMDSAAHARLHPRVETSKISTVE